MQVTTNGTIWTPYVEWLLERFTVDISISIDAHTPSTYAKVRRGGDHHALMRNIEKFEKSCELRDTDLHVSYCLMENNWHELGRFLVWAERFRVPASVNLVTDLGLALHDLQLESLLDVQQAWNEESMTIQNRLINNKAVWDTQMVQLEHVIAERRKGVAPAPRQAQRATATFFELSRAKVGREPAPHGASAAKTGLIELERHRLAAWSNGGTVGEISIDLTGVISSVDHSHPRIGVVPEELVDRPFNDIAELHERALGVPSWIVEHAHVNGSVVRNIVASADRPTRGTTGPIIRWVEIPHDEGWTALVAEDRIYDTEENEVGVELSPVRR